MANRTVINCKIIFTQIHTRIQAQTLHTIRNFAHILHTAELYKLTLVNTNSYKEVLFNHLKQQVIQIKLYITLRRQFIVFGLENR